MAYLLLRLKPLSSSPGEHHIRVWQARDAQLASIAETRALEIT
jgi:hypothetical protein